MKGSDGEDQNQGCSVVQSQSNVNVATGSTSSTRTSESNNVMGEHLQIVASTCSNERTPTIPCNNDTSHRTSLSAVTNDTITLAENISAKRSADDCSEPDPAGAISSIHSRNLIDDTSATTTKMEPDAKSSSTLALTESNSQLPADYSSAMLSTTTTSAMENKVEVKKGHEVRLPYDAAFPSSCVEDGSVSVTSTAAMLELKKENPADAKAAEPIAVGGSAPERKPEGSTESLANNCTKPQISSHG